MTPRDWNAESYQRISAPMEAMGREVLDRLELRGDERVLDAGCGTGRVTAALVERLPRGEVVAVDGSPAMVAEARERLGPGVEVFAADLLELELDEPVDAILSTATFHWIPDHDRLFDRLFAALRPGGRLVAQCGGAGNVATVQAAIDAVAEPALAGWAGPWTFASPEETTARLERSGFTDARAWLQQVRVEPDDPREYMGDDHARLAPGAAAGGAARRVRRRRPRGHAGAGRRVRPAQHHREAGRCFLNGPPAATPQARAGPHRGQATGRRRRSLPRRDQPPLGRPADRRALRRLVGDRALLRLRRRASAASGTPATR